MMYNGSETRFILNKTKQAGKLDQIILPENVSIDKVEHGLWQTLNHCRLSGEIIGLTNCSVSLLEKSGLLIQLVNSGSPLGPNHLQIDQSLNFKKLQIPAGEHFKLSKFCLEIREIGIFPISPRSFWKISSINKSIDYTQLKINLKFLTELLMDNYNPEGLSLIQSGIDLLNDVAQSADFTRLPFVLKYLVGKGTGFTPTGDDIIIGLIHSLGRLFTLNQSPLEKFNFLAGLSLEATEKTTCLAANMINYSLMGKYYQLPAGLCDSLAGKDSTIIANSFFKLISAERSSGTSIIVGILIGGIMVMKHCEKMQILPQKNHHC